MENYDFSGWATKANLKCSDGRTIMKDAFKAQDGALVPLVWNHQHNDPEDVLGHALLENRDEGVYAYCTFNESETGKTAKLLVQHGDVSALSIYANQLQQNLNNVVHGNIREVSLVLAGANPGAFIDAVIKHGEESDEEAVIYTGEPIELFHSEEAAEEPAAEEPAAEVTEEEGELAHSDEKKATTVGDVYNSFTEEQKTVVHALIGEALAMAGVSDDDESNEKSEGGSDMKHNVFENDTQENTLAHDAMETIINDGKRYGSLKESFLAHAQDYGIENIDYLFPEAKSVNNTPEYIKRDTSWVATVMNGVGHTPFSRIKSVFADITADEARAKGYIKGKLKKEEVFSLLKRTTTPTTIYKKQKLDRDDIIDITDMDVVAFIKSEMRLMLDEEIARAILVSDGRLTSDDDHINTDCVRPIWTDKALYTIKKRVDLAAGSTGADKARAFIDACIRARKDYKGSGNPVCFTTEDMVTECLLLEDSIGRKIYPTVESLATTLRVSKIVTVEVMEGLTRVGTVADDGDTDTRELGAILVNLNDYKVGADKGGAIAMFDDFDIDYNQQKYLIETRISGALIKPYSAIAVEFVQA
ncbi:MAG: HK97 family phage prohead protease [Eubacterium sp.]|nr:HK97 family phage prohead protease [Candidatus Colimonas fimequi]